MSTSPADDGALRPDGEQYPAFRTEAQWQVQLEPQEYAVLRLGGTERPFSGEYENTTSPGTYRCRGCGAALFSSETKFDAQCGWPAFYAPTDDDAVVLLKDHSLGVERTEVRCAACGSHLGHVFAGEGFATPTDERYCINSVCLDLTPGTDT